MVLTLGDAVNVALSHGGGLFSTAHAVDNGKDFVRARPGVTTQVAVGDLQYQSVTAHLTTQELLDVSGSVVLAVVGANDLQTHVAGARPSPSTSHSSSVAKSQARIAMKEDKDEANGIADSMRQDWYPKVASTQQIGNDWNECEKRNIDHASDTLIVMH